MSCAVLFEILHIQFSQRKCTQWTSFVELISFLRLNTCESIVLFIQFNLRKQSSFTLDCCTWRNALKELGHYGGIN